MPIPIILALAAAGAAAGGGIGAAIGGMIWFKRETDSAAAEEVKADSRNIQDILRQKMSEQQVREEARAVGVDVDAAVAGYRAAQAGVVDLQTVVTGIVSGVTGVPIPDAESGWALQSHEPLPLQSDRVTSNAEIRRWARENGRPVSDKGPIPRRVLDAFRSAH